MKMGKITVASIAIFAVDDSNAGGRGSMRAYWKREQPNLVSASARLETVGRVSGPGESGVRLRGG